MEPISGRENYIIVTTEMGRNGSMLQNSNAPVGYEKFFPVFRVCGLLMNQGGENCIAGFTVSTIVWVNLYE